MSASHYELVGFIRTTLGCGCPDEVLKTIRVGNDGDVVQLDVGGRLLVWLVPAEGLELAGIAAAGRSIRDRDGFNRFRLVVVTDDTAAGERLRAEWAALDLGDDRLHLHVLEPEAVPPGLR